MLRPPQIAINLPHIIKEPLWVKKNYKEQKSVHEKEKGNEQEDIDLAKWSSERKDCMTLWISFHYFLKYNPAAQIKRTMAEMLEKKIQASDKSLGNGQ